MKALFLIVTAALSYFSMQECTKLQGTYTVQFDKKYHLESYRITYTDSTYLKVMRDAVSSKGEIVYDQYKAALKSKSDNPIMIDCREMVRIRSIL